MKSYMLALVAVAAIGQVDTNVKLSKRVHELEKEVRVLRNYYNANAGTEYAMSSQEEEWTKVMREFKRRLDKCCP